MYSPNYNYPQRIEVQDVNNFYDFLAKLVDRTPWANEYDKEVFAQLIAKLRELNVFGYMVSTTTVDNPDKYRAKFRG